MRKPHRLLFVVPVFFLQQAFGQCNNYTLNWDNRDFLDANNATMATFVNQARTQNQSFVFGANKVNVAHNYTSANLLGENITHTGETGSFGTGADVQFRGNGTITLTFDAAVTNLQFSIYDIDRSQRVTVSGLNGIAPIAPTLARIGGGTSILTLNTTVVYYAQAAGTNEANTSRYATLNISFATAVTSVTLVISGTTTNGTEDGSFWLSDITACSPGSLPNNYNSSSIPFVGQPSYVIIAVNNSFYYMNPATGISKFIFQDNSNANMNSVAYDPIHRFIYYTYSLSGSGGTVNQNEKGLRRYSIAMDTFGLVSPNVNNFGVPTYQQGVESGAAAFYNGSLYFGIEGGLDTKSVIWKIDFDNSPNPVPTVVSQVSAFESIEVVNSGWTTINVRRHDWSDFGIYDGVLYDFNGGDPDEGGANFYVENLLTGTSNTYLPNPGTLVPGQISADWQGNFFDVYTASGSGRIVGYNKTNGHSGSVVNITYNGAALAGSYGDAAEGYRPMADFGDAPSSYDPITNSPALNEYNPNIRIGTGYTNEYSTRGQTSNANSDTDEGIGTVTVLSPIATTYGVSVTVRNNTGTTARLIGWLDYNNNGVFDASEASTTATVNSSASNQTIALNWPILTGGVAASLPNGSYSFLRVRFATAATGMSANSATGWLDNGETEDYQVVVTSVVLPLNLLSFEASKKDNETVELNWTTAETSEQFSYVIERSQNGLDWTQIGTSKSSNFSGTNSYTFIDKTPLVGENSYRLKLVSSNGAIKYSEIRSIKVAGIDAALIIITPNPATTKAVLRIGKMSIATSARISIVDFKGAELTSFKQQLRIGDNDIILPLNGRWPSGTYLVKIFTGDATITKKLLIRK